MFMEIGLEEKCPFLFPFKKNSEYILEKYKVFQAVPDINEKGYTFIKGYEKKVR